jgi:hypothetical protein
MRCQRCGAAASHRRIGATLSRVRSGILALALGGLLATGCANVRPYERERLASPAMSARFGEDGFAGEYRAKVTESKTGGGLPGDAPGGGCGCTQ